jgi:hypothetical protein
MKKTREAKTPRACSLSYSTEWSHQTHCVSQGLGTRPPEVTTVAAICSNCGINSLFKLGIRKGSVFYETNSVACEIRKSRVVPTAFSRCERGGPGARALWRSCFWGAGGRGAATGEPHQTGTSGSQRRVVSAAHEPGRVGCRLWGVGAAFWCPKWPVPLSQLFGGGLESHINPLKSVGTASGWCRVGHTATYRPGVREDIRANTLDPPRTQNSGLKSPLTLDTRRGARGGRGVVPGGGSGAGPCHLPRSGSIYIQAAVIGWEESYIAVGLPARASMEELPSISLRVSLKAPKAVSSANAVSLRALLKDFNRMRSARDSPRAKRGAAI